MKEGRRHQFSSGVSLTPKQTLYGLPQTSPNSKRGSRE